MKILNSKQIVLAIALIGVCGTTSARVGEVQWERDSKLFKAIMDKKPKEVELAIKAGANVNATGSSLTYESWTPLHIASTRKYANKDIANILIKAGANVDAKTNEGRTPLHYAVIGGKKDLVKQFIEAGADVNTQDNNNLTPWEYSWDLKNKNIEKILLEAGAG